MIDDILTNARKIEIMLQEIEVHIESLPEAAYEKATCFATYDRKIAVVCAKIKSGLITYIEDFNGEKIPISATPANLILIYSKGICHMELLAKIAGEAGYKGIITMIDARKAQLNGLQSINKVLQ